MAEKDIQKMDTLSEYNIPSNPELKTSTVVRFGQSAASLGLGEGLRQKERLGYNPTKEGKKHQGESDSAWGKSAVPYLQRDDIENSRWFAGVKVLDSLIMSFPAFTTDHGKKYARQAIEIQNMLMHIQQKKNIQRTRIAGRDGRVKQYISLDDYDVTVKGVIVGFNSFKTEDGFDILGGGFHAGERPDVAIHAFNEFMEAPTSFNVSCDFLKFNGINTCTIEGFKMNQQIGRLDNQAFQFKMLSDSKFEIIIEEF